MFDLILGVAKKDERVWAVYMNGSRTNPNVSKDIFQDYDIVFVVTEIIPFIKNKTWIQQFGELLMIQEPDKNDKSIGMKIDFSKSYMYLMLFTDGNRIDLRLQTIDTMKNHYLSDKLTVPLLDKDNILPLIPASTDIDYHVKQPTASMYMSCCNNFWWCLQNVAKGIWRDELPYAKQMFEQVIRVNLDEMVSWWIGTKHDFQVSPGKMGKYFKHYLSGAYWDMYEKTFSDHHYDHFWNSIFVACELFRSLAKDVENQLALTYPLDDDTNMMKYLKHVRNLASDAKRIFD